jgi:hypothetical protein
VHACVEEADGLGVVSGGLGRGTGQAGQTGVICQHNTVHTSNQQISPLSYGELMSCVNTSPPVGIVA